MSIQHLGRSAHRFVRERLERLQFSLEGLTQRLRESVSHLVGAHVGQAIRDSLGAFLLRQSPDRVALRFDAHDEYEPPEEEGEDDPVWGHPPPEPVRDRPGRWKGLLTGAVQVVSVWLRHRTSLRPFRLLVCLGALAGLTTLAVGPLVGGLVTTAVASYLLTRPACPVENDSRRVSWEGSR